MILQINSALHRLVQKGGCYFMSLIEKAVKYLRIEVDPTRINQLYGVSRLHRWIEPDCTILLPQEILGHLGLKVHYLGHMPADYECTPGEFDILHFTHAVYQHHFTGGDGRAYHGGPGAESHVTYDPYGRCSSARYGVLADKRVFRIIREDR